MKKLALALMLALPVMFAACSKDEEKDVEKSFYAPVTMWGTSQTQVQLAVPTDKNLVLATELCTENVLAYVTGYVTEANPLQLPWYQYVFVNDALDGANVYEDTQYKAEYTAWLDANYHRYEAEAGDDFITYGNQKDESKSTLYIFYDEYTPENSTYTYLRTEWIERVITPAQRASRAGMSDRQILREKANAAAEANFNL